MKGLITILLIVIAAGVGYLAFSEYQKREVAREIAYELKYPGVRLTKKWIGLASLKCESIYDPQIENDPDLGRIPQSFQCLTNTGVWLMTQLPYEQCNELTRRSLDNAKYPEKDGEIFHASGIICWSARRRI